MPAIPQTIQDLWVSDEGTYGHNDIVLVDTSGWTDSDREELEFASDSERLDIAVSIAKKRGSRWQHA
jgi:hypothetical protein